MAPEPVQRNNDRKWSKSSAYIAQNVHEIVNYDNLLCLVCCSLGIESTVKYLGYHISAIPVPLSPSVLQQLQYFLKIVASKMHNNYYIKYAM